MRFPIGAMSVGDVLDRGLKIMLSRLGLFYLINLLVLMPIILIELALPAIQQFDLARTPPEQLPLILGAICGGIFLILLLTLILQPLGTGAILHVIAREFADQRATIGEAFHFAAQRFWKILGASILYGLIITLGLMALCVPGILFAIWYVFIAQVVVVEGLGPTAALTRSKDLTEGFRDRVIGIGVLLFLIQVALSMAVFPLAILLPSQEMVPVQDGVRPVFNHTNYYITTVFGRLVGILGQTYGAVCWTLFYFDLRIRKEGFDLELAAQQQSAEAT